jgi:hypothetical protein
LKLFQRRQIPTLRESNKHFMVILLKSLLVPKEVPLPCSRCILNKHWISRMSRSYKVETVRYSHVFNISLKLRGINRNLIGNRILSSDVLFLYLKSSICCWCDRWLSYYSRDSTYFYLLLLFFCLLDCIIFLFVNEIFTEPLINALIMPHLVMMIMVLVMV